MALATTSILYQIQHGPQDRIPALLKRVVDQRVKHSEKYVHRCIFAAIGRGYR